jgi:hypothetical protein
MLAFFKTRPGNLNNATITPYWYKKEWEEGTRDEESGH